MESRHRETVTALIRHGLRLEWLVEHDWTVWERFPGSLPMAGELGRFPCDMPRIPLTYSLLARPATGHLMICSPLLARCQLIAIELWISEGGMSAARADS